MCSDQSFCPDSLSLSFFLLSFLFLSFHKDKFLPFSFSIMITIYYFYKGTIYDLRLCPCWIAFHFCIQVFIHDALFKCLL